MKINYLIIGAWLVVLLVHSEKVSSQDYIFGPEIDNWSEATKEQQRVYGQEFLQQLRDAKANGSNSIVLSHDHYRFKKSYSDNPSEGHIYASGLHNLTIDGDGATFWFEDYHTALMFKNCTDVTLQNLVFDYDPVPQAQGVITNVGDQFLEIENEEGFLTCSEINAMAGNTKSKVFVFENDTTLFKKDVPHIVASGFQDMGDNKTRITGNAVGGYKFNGPPDIEVGDRVCVVFHMGHGVVFEECYNTTLDNFSLYASTQYGIAVRLGGGFKMINSNIIQRPGTKRLMTTNQDGIHFQSNEVGPHIENCKLSGMADDVMNVHGDFDMVQRQLDSNQGLISIRNFLLLEEGDTLNIYDVNTYHRKAQVRIESVSPSNDPDDLADAKTIGDEFNINFWVGRYSMKVTFDKDVDLSRGDVIENPSKGSYGTYVANNHVYNSSTRGIIVKAKDAVVTGNHVENIAVSGILTLASLEWLDAVFPENVEISNNTLLDVGWSMNSRLAGQNKLGAIVAIVEYYGSLKRDLFNAVNITIKDNYIENTPLAGIFALHLDGGEISGNTIKKYINGDKGRMGQQLGIEPFSAIYIADSKDVIIENNQISQPGINAEEEIRYGPNVFSSEEIAEVTFIVKDGDKELENAVVFFNATVKYTDNAGSASFSDVPVGQEHNVGVNMTGYKSFNKDIYVEKDTTVTIQLESFESGADLNSNKPGQFVLYPNPVSKFIYIDTKSAAEMTLLNTEGKMVDRASLYPGHNRFNVNNLENGVYFIKLRNAEMSDYLKIVKTGSGTH